MQRHGWIEHTILTYSCFLVLGSSSLTASYILNMSNCASAATSWDDLSKDAFVNNKLTLPTLHGTASWIKHGYILDFGRKFGIGSWVSGAFLVDDSVASCASFLSFCLCQLASPFLDALIVIDSVAIHQPGSWSGWWLCHIRDFFLFSCSTISKRESSHVFDTPRSMASNRKPWYGVLTLSLLDWVGSLKSSLLTVVANLKTAGAASTMSKEKQQ